MIELDVTNMMADVLGEKGISERQVENLRDMAAKAHNDIVSKRWPELAFMDLVDQDTAEIKEMASDIRKSSESFVLLGIGGSALGPKTILEALSPLHSLRKTPRVFILDNVDPVTVGNVLSIIDPEKTTVNVITKSGSTAETMSSFMVLFERLKPARFVATTDPVKGALRKIATESGMRTLPVPPAVGGRYSVLSPVGLLLAEVIGASADELLRGAKKMSERCGEPDVWKNPAYLFGSLLYLAERDGGRKINVMVPYADRLRPLSEWYCQLWAESLGKQGMGSTPYPSIGTIDQHSQLQLWMEGPEDKAFIFIRVKDHGADVRIPAVFKESEIGYLGGHSLAELMDAEEESTELCLRKAGRPSMTVAVPAIDACRLGQLFYLFELATAFAGSLYGVNPFDQPSVEMGKNFTYGMMGRKGFEAMRAEVEAARRRKPRRRL